MVIYSAVRSSVILKESSHHVAGDLSTIYNEDQTLTDSLKGINTTDSAETGQFMKNFIASNYGRNNIMIFSECWTNKMLDIFVKLCSESQWWPGAGVKVSWSGVSYRVGISLSRHSHMLRSDGRCQVSYLPSSRSSTTAQPTPGQTSQYILFFPSFPTLLWVQFLLIKLTIREGNWCLTKWTKYTICPSAVVVLCSAGGEKTVVST